MKRYLLLGLIVLSVLGLRAQDTVSDHYQTNQFDVVIFSKEYKSDFSKHVKRFTPSKHDIDTAEYALLQFFSLPFYNHTINSGYNSFNPILNGDAG